MTQFMNVLVFALLSPVLFAGALAAQTNREPSKFTIAVRADKSEINLGSDITIAITITNISEEEISIGCGYHGNMPDGYQYDMQDERGTKVPKVLSQDPLRPIRVPGNPMPGGCGIKPGKSMENHATISDNYNFNHPGKYTIRVWRPATKGSPDKPELNLFQYRYHHRASGEQQAVNGRPPPTL
jgi:hypothetical protein